jgi:hypothetical protein
MTESGRFSPEFRTGTLQVSAPAALASIISDINVNADIVKSMTLRE